MNNKRIYTNLRLLVTLVLMAMCLSIQAQSKKDKKLAKSLAAEAKSLVADGWIVFGSKSSLYDLLLSKHQMQEETIEDGSPVVKSRYSVVSASAKASSINAAVRIAQTMAKSQLSAKLGVDVETTAFSTLSNASSDGQTVSSEQRTGEVINKSVSTDMSKAFEIFTLYREVPGGMYEVMTNMAIDNE